jgi:ankyrin repeat protein
MGRVIIPLSDIKEGQTFEKWVPLGLSNGMDKVSGEIYVQITLGSTPTDKSRSIKDLAMYNSKSTYTFVPMHQSPSTEIEDSPLFVAIRNSALTQVLKLLSEPNVNINQQDSHGYTPLHAACVIFSEHDDEIMLALLNTKGSKTNTLY